MQWIFIYFYSSLHKSFSTWQTGEAIYQALSLERYANQPFAQWLLHLIDQHFIISSTLSQGVVFIERYIILFLLIPISFKLWRTLGICFFIFVHLSFSLFLDIGLFTFYMTAGWLAFIPRDFWTKTVLKKENFYQSKLITQILAICSLVLVFSWNHLTLPKKHWAQFEIPRTLRILTIIPRLDQQWDMFTPQPSIEDGWYVIHGKLSNQKQVELWQSQTNPKILDDLWKKPEDVSNSYLRQRWRKYLENLMLRQHSDSRVYFAEYLCRTYNHKKEKNQKLSSFKIYFMMEKTKPYASRSLENIIHKETLWQQFC